MLALTQNEVDSSSVERAMEVEMEARGCGGDVPSATIGAEELSPAAPRTAPLLAPSLDHPYLSIEAVSLIFPL